MDLLYQDGGEEDWGRTPQTETIRPMTDSPQTETESPPSELAGADVQWRELGDRAHHLNQNLETLGFKAALPLTVFAHAQGGNASTQDLRSIMDVIQTLLAQRRRDMNQLDSLRINQRKLDSNFRRLAVEKNNLAAKCGVIQREVEESRLHLQRMKQKQKQQRRLYEEAKSSQERCISTLEKREASYVAKLRKQEVDYNKLRARLRKLSNADKTECIASKSKIQMTLGQTLKRATGNGRLRRMRKENMGRNCTPAPSVSDISALHLEEKLKLLHSENNEFREICNDLQECVFDCSRRVEQVERVLLCSQRAGRSGSGCLEDTLSSNAAALPLEWIRLSTVGNIKTKVLELNDRIASLDVQRQVGQQSSPLAEHNKDGGALAEARDIISEQSLLIRYYLLQRRRARKLLSERRGHIALRRSLGRRSCSNSSSGECEHMIGSQNGLLNLATTSGTINLISVEILSMEQEMLEQEKKWLKQERKSLKKSRSVLTKENVSDYPRTEF